MQKPTQQLNSPFRQKIFDLIKHQETSKILKLSSRMFQNKTTHTTHSPFRQFSIDTEPIDQSNIVRLDTSDGPSHFKSLQQKLGLIKPSKSKSNDRKSRSVSQQNSNPKFMQKPKKVSFIENLGKTYYKPSKSTSKDKSRNKLKKQNSLQKSNTSRNLKKYSSSKGKSSKKQSASQSFQSSSKNIKTYDAFNESNHKNNFSSSANNFQSNDKQTQKKNYLLQTLKKMQSVRKNLTQTFQQFDKYNNGASQSKIDQKSKKKSKQKSRSNLTVMSDYVAEQNESIIKYGFKENVNKKSKSKHKNQKHENQKSIKNIFHKKTPNKKEHNKNDSLQINNSHSLLKTKSVIQKDLLKQLRISCKNPQKWQTILRNELISVHFRVVKRKLIEIQIHAQSQLQNLEIQLQKGYFICQSLKQKYMNVRKKEIITLLCSVRGIDFRQGEINLLEMPKLFINIEAKVQQSPITFKKQVDLPYSWVMLVQKQKKDKFNQSSSKKSKKQDLSNRIKTRSRLQGIQLKKNDKLPNIVEIFSFCEIQDHFVSAKKQPLIHHKSISKELVHATSSNLKTKQSYTLSFELEDFQFKLFVKINPQDNHKKSIPSRRTYSLQLEGKGQALMNKIIGFLELLG